MTQRNDGGPAFGQVVDMHCVHVDPCGATEREPSAAVPGGLSIRDYFAAKAMQAAATNPKGADGFTFEQRAEWAYQQADALLAARERT